MYGSTLHEVRRRRAQRHDRERGAAARALDRDHGDAGRADGVLRRNGVIDATMCRSDWITLGFNDWIVTLADVLPARIFSTGFTGR